jgi:glycosyltransferase involved in cell wall biosynthesis
MSKETPPNSIYMQNMKHGFPLVTVITICYNHEKYAVECLEGVRNQSYQNVQWIIIDDCSNDNSVKIISDWIQANQIKCKFIAHEKNVGLPRTINEALEISDGKYVSIISTDDIWLPEFIEDRVQKFENHDEMVGLVYGKSFKIDENGNQLPGLFQDCQETPEGYVLRDLYKRNFICSNSILIRKSCYDKIGRYNENLTLEDYDMWIRIGREYKFIYSDKILSKYRILRNSLDHSNRGIMADNVSRILLQSLEINPENKEIIIERLIPLRNMVYRLGHPIAPTIYQKALKKNFTKKDLFLLVSSGLRIPYESSMRFVENGGRH